jgi:hypothetical protein
MQQTIVNPFYAARIRRRTNSAQVATPSRDEPSRVVYAKLPLAPINGSPVPHLTSLYHFSRAGEYGDRNYPGNCGGNLIKDLLRYFFARTCFDPMAGSGTCRDVCNELGIYCWSSDLNEGTDACDSARIPPNCFDFCWVHPPYWRQKLYTNDPRDLSRAPTLAAFLDRYRLLIANCAGALAPGGKLAILMGDYNDREAGFVPLVHHTLCGRTHNGCNVAAVFMWCRIDFTAAGAVPAQNAAT